MGEDSEVRQGVGVSRRGGEDALEGLRFGFYRTQCPDTFSPRDIRQ